MKKLLSIIMMSCSLLLASSVSYASDGEKTTKSEVVIVDADNLNVSNVAIVAAERGMKITVVTTDEVQNYIGNDAVIILDGLMARKEVSLNDLCNEIIFSSYETHNIYFDLPIDVGLQSIKHYPERHNKSLYNQKINKGYATLHKSDLIRSNCALIRNNYLS